MNVGRLEVVTMALTYAQLVRAGHIQNGIGQLHSTNRNFVNILAAQYARRIGVPVGGCLVAVK